MRITLKFDTLEPGGGYEWARIVGDGLVKAGHTIQWKAKRVKHTGNWTPPPVVPDAVPADVTLDSSSGSNVTYPDQFSRTTVRILHGLLPRKNVRASVADRMVAVSESVRNHIGGNLPIDVIFNGIDFTRLPEPKPLGPLFGFCGRNVKNKRLDFARMVSVRASISLIEYGPGTIYGYVDDPWKYLNGRIKALLLPSRKEGLSLVACEAVCLGIPVYMFPSAAALELRPFVTVVNSSSATAWARRVPELPNLEQARKVFNSERMVKRWVNYVENL